MYRGKLLDGQLIAIKRSKQGSMQGGLEFKTEIELLSRVHHNNLVGLVGFCFDKGEKMLVYEFISNGTLSEALYGTLTCSSISLSEVTSIYMRRVPFLANFRNQAVHIYCGTVLPNLNFLFFMIISWTDHNGSL